MADSDISAEAPPPWDEDVPERDPDTADIFGAPEPAPVPAAAPAPALVAEPQDQGAAYTVLARKYRPRNFEDLIGQEAMVRTLTNAFASGRIAHAFGMDDTFKPGRAIGMLTAMLFQLVLIIVAVMAATGNL